MKKVVELLWRKVAWIYFGILSIFAYFLIENQIPDHIYVSRNEQISFQGNLPVLFETTDVPEDTAVMSDVSVQNNTGFSEVGPLYDYEIDCYLLGFLPMKSVKVSVVDKEAVYASGRVIGLYEKMSGVFVLKTQEIEDDSGYSQNPSEGNLEAGDYILAIDGEEVHTKEEVIQKVQENQDQVSEIRILRDQKEMTVFQKGVKSKEGNYLLGVWVKDDMAGIGTMTYYKSTGEFGALGHGIGDGETGHLLVVDSGSIYTASLVGITKGRKGEPGELEGMIYYSSACCIGTINNNSEMGIYGSLRKRNLQEMIQEDELYEVGYKQEVHMGKAQILSDVSGQIQAYDILITDLVYQPEESNKGIHIEVTDAELLELTGGIVQGLSGSPIIQDGKIIGAVTHVLVNDPTSGYGVFIENMLDIQAIR